jgi:hypothetical protein
MMRGFCCCLFLLLCSTLAHAQENSCFSAWPGDFLAVLDADSTLPLYSQAVAFSRGYIASGTGQSAPFREQAPDKPHTARLTWKASSSPVAGYNVYRSTVSGQKYQKINSSLVQGLTYADSTVLSGKTYYYVTRAVDDQGHESANSNETSVLIP